MRLVLQALGVCMLVIVVAAASGLLVLTHEGTALDSESKAFVDRAVVAIASGWSQEQLLSRASPEFRATTSSSQISGLFETLSLLGAMVEYQGATGEAKISYMILPCSSGHLVERKMLRGDLPRGTGRLRAFIFSAVTA